jgi:hypothetical protein
MLSPARRGAANTGTSAADRSARDDLQICLDCGVEFASDASEWPQLRMTAARCYGREWARRSSSTTARDSDQSDLSCERRSAVDPF